MLLSALSTQYSVLPRIAWRTCHSKTLVNPPLTQHHPCTPSPRANPRRSISSRSQKTPSAFNPALFLTPFFTKSANPSSQSYQTVLPIGLQIVVPIAQILALALPLPPDSPSNTIFPWRTTGPNQLPVPVQSLSTTLSEIDNPLLLLLDNMPNFPQRPATPLPHLTERLATQSPSPGPHSLLLV